MHLLVIYIPTITPAPSSPNRPTYLSRYKQLCNNIAQMMSTLQSKKLTAKHSDDHKTSLHKSKRRLDSYPQDSFPCFLNSGDTYSNPENYAQASLKV